MLGAIAMMTACTNPGASDPLAQVRMAVQAPPAGIDEIEVDEGADGLSRYVMLVLHTSGDQLSPEALTETLDLVGDALPEVYDGVRVVARSAADGRIALDEAVLGAGLDESSLVSPERAHLTADAVRALADSDG